MLNALLVFGILKLLLKYQSTINNRQFHDWSAGIGALLFAFHPVQVEPVAWVTGAKDLLSAFFSLIAVWQYLRYATAREKFNSISSQKHLTPKSSILILTISNRNYIFASLAFLMALLAKPAAVIAPIIIWILDYWILKRSVKDSFVALIGWVGVALLFIVATLSAQSGASINFTAPLWSRPLIAGDALTFYLNHLAFPQSLGIDYGRSPAHSMQHSSIYFSWLIPAGLIVIIFVVKKLALYKPALLIFLIGVFPVSGLVPFSFQNYSTVADRYLYFSMLGPSLALGMFSFSNQRRSIVLFFLLIVGLLGLKSSAQLWNWKDKLSLYEQALKVNSNSYLAYNNLCVLYEQKNKIEKAIFHCTKALQINSDHSEAHINFGVALTKKGEFISAISHYKEALAIKPNNATVYTNMGTVFLKQKEFKIALSQFSKALRVNPDYAEAFNGMGVVFAKQENYKEAIAKFSKALKIKPYYAEAHNNIGSALAEQGKTNKAISHFISALEIEPDFTEAKNNLEIALMDSKK